MSEMKRSARTIRVLIAGIILIAVSAGLGFGAAAVSGSCMKPYAECVGQGHAGQALSGAALFVLAAVTGFVGIVTVLACLWALVQEARLR